MGNLHQRVLFFKHTTFLPMSDIKIHKKDGKSSFLFTLVRLVQNELGSVKEMPHLLSPFTQKTNFTSSLGYELLRLLTSFLEAPVIFFYYNKNYTSF